MKHRDFVKLINYWLRNNSIDFYLYTFVTKGNFRDHYDILVNKQKVIRQSPIQFSVHLSLRAHLIEIIKRNHRWINTLAKRGTTEKEGKKKAAAREAFSRSLR